MNFMSIYANIYNSTSVISKIFLFYLSVYKSCTSSPLISSKNFHYLRNLLYTIHKNLKLRS